MKHKRREKPKRFCCFCIDAYNVVYFKNTVFMNRLSVPGIKYPVPDVSPVVIVLAHEKECIFDLLEKHFNNVFYRL